ncbi:metal ABC transporter ATP-binding protein [Bacillus massiliglaciei]|uniref:metal ABC transporter ATP-binding protein n=1 Tax=Bacillus massiliglaciei TaxID=1816693 RepID=UPI000B1E8ECF|nr:metal ABC transporter ATP-binding protein [Bacillus massiliglaciei]
MLLVKADRVRFGYGHIPSLENVSFEVKSGEFVGVTGPNGASKSTLLKIILGLLTPWDGEIYLSEKNEKGDRLKIGYVPQQIASFNAGFPSTVWELVRSGRYQKGKWFSKMNADDEKIIQNSLEMTGMWEFRNQKIGSLSGGQKQKICISRVLASEPDLLILDEPTAGMDVESRKSFYAFMSHRVKKHRSTIMMVTHDQDDVKPYLDKIIHLEKGERDTWKCLTLHSCSGHFGPAGSLR